jgi:hypothetical protein
MSTSDSEIDDLDVSRLPVGQEEIAWREIAVDDPALVQVSERIRHGGGDRERIAHAQPIREKTLLQVHAIQPGHDHERSILRGQAVRDVLDDMGMIEGREAVCLVLKSIGARAITEDLHGHGSMGLPIVRPVDDARSARCRTSVDLEPIGDQVAGMKRRFDQPRT